MPIVNASGERFKYDTFDISHRIPHFPTLNLYFIGLHIDKKTLTPDELAAELLCFIKKNAPLREAPDILALSEFCRSIFPRGNFRDCAPGSRVEFLKAFSIAHSMFSPTEVAVFTCCFKLGRGITEVLRLFELHKFSKSELENIKNERDLLCPRLFKQHTTPIPWPFAGECESQ